MLKKAINCINSNLVSIYQKSIDMEQLSKKVMRHIPQHLQASVKVAGFEKGTLSLTLNNHSVANELRYLLPELRSDLRQKEHMHQLVQIKLLK